MEETQRRKEIDAKADVSRWLIDEGDAFLMTSGFHDVDSRLVDYADGLISHPERHNVYELLALRRSLQFTRRYTFDIKRASMYIQAIERLKFPTERGMGPIRLSPVQCFALANIYGFKLDDGRRLCRNGLLMVPRKFGKTTLSSGIAVCELLLGEANAQVYTCANSYDQAKICFDSIRSTLRAMDPTGAKFKVNREKIFNKMQGRSSFARCLAADPSTLDGLNASCYILDEFSQAKSSELRQVMATSTGTRPNPLELIITTASSLQEGPFVDTLRAYKSILLGDVEDDTVFALIFQPDVDDREDDPDTWHKVQPHLGVTIKEDYYARQWQKAQLTADDMLAFRTKLLNVFACDDRKTWLSYSEIESLFTPSDYDFEANAGRPIAQLPVAMVSFDLSVWDDFSVICYELYDPLTKRFHFHLDYYLPEATLGKHEHADLYRQWAAKGHLHLVPGEVVDYVSLAKDIINRNGKVRIAGISYDPYHSKQMVSTLQAFGAGPVLHPMKQTYGAFTGAVESLELLVKTRSCSFSPNPITAWCFSNCNMDEDRLGNRKPIKYVHSLKIDGAICCLMSQDAFNNAKR